MRREALNRPIYDSVAKIRSVWAGRTCQRQGSRGVGQASPTCRHLPKSWKNKRSACSLPGGVNTMDLALPTGS